MNFRNWLQTTKRSTYPLPYDCTLANASVCYTKLSMLCLQTGKTLIYVANFSNVFTKCKYAWIAA